MEPEVARRKIRLAQEQNHSILVYDSIKPRVSPFKRIW